MDSSTLHNIYYRLHKAQREINVIEKIINDYLEKEKKDIEERNKNKPKCNGKKWFWRSEIDPEGYNEEARRGISDDTHYSCPRCHGSGVENGENEED